MGVYRDVHVGPGCGSANSGGSQASVGAARMLPRVTDFVLGRAGGPRPFGFQQPAVTKFRALQNLFGTASQCLASAFVCLRLFVRAWTLDVWGLLRSAILGQEP